MITKRKTAKDTKLQVKDVFLQLLLAKGRRKVNKKKMKIK